MTPAEILEREQAREHYIEWLNRCCRKHDEDPERKIGWLPQETRSRANW